MTPLSYLSLLCQRWGGTIELVHEEQFRNIPRSHGLSRHPSGTHAIDRADRRIYAVRAKADPGTIIHEMGHVFLAEAPPFYSYEPDWLGWEIALARRAQCFRGWSKQNIGYLYDFEGEDREWSQPITAEIRRFIADRIDYATEIGIVSRDGIPLCTRRS